MNVASVKKRAVVMFCCLAAVCFLLASPAWAVEEPVIHAKGALLMDMETGKVLWEQNGYQLFEPASTTKILTALLALDLDPVDKECIVTPEAALVGESSANLQTGERFTLKNLLTGALVKSANDACYAIGDAVAGSEPLFVNWMNKKAQAIGAYDANIRNTNGLPDEEHKMSCYDLALIARLDMQHPLFRELVSSTTATMEGGNYNRFLKNTNKLLKTNPNVIGIKTGTTNRAGACLVSAMDRDGRRVISVVLNSPDRYGESERILNYGIDQFENTCYIEKGATMGFYPDENSKEGGTTVIAESTGVATIPKGQAEAMHLVFQWKPVWNEEEQKGAVPTIQAGDLLGTAQLVDNNNKIYSRVNLLAKEDLSYSKWFHVKNYFREKFH